MLLPYKASFLWHELVKYKHFLNVALNRNQQFLQCNVSQGVAREICRLRVEIVLRLYSFHFEGLESTICYWERLSVDISDPLLWQSVPVPVLSWRGAEPHPQEGRRQGDRVQPLRPQAGGAAVLSSVWDCLRQGNNNNNNNNSNSSTTHYHYCSIFVTSASCTMTRTNNNSTVTAVEFAGWVHHNTIVT